jgi:hypothetical protein
MLTQQQRLRPTHTRNIKLAFFSISSSRVNLPCLIFMDRSMALSAAAASSSSDHQAFLQQQLLWKDEIIAELRSSKAALAESKDAVIESREAMLKSEDALIQSKDAVIEAKNQLLVKLQEPLAQQPDSPASSNADTAALATRLAVAEARLQQWEAAGGADGSTHTSAELPDRDQKRARHYEGCTQPLEKNEVLDEIFGYVGRKEWLFVGAVCRRWRGRYLSMCYKARADKAEHAFQTSHSSTFTTAARFLLALDNGLEMPDEDEASDSFDDLPKLSQQPIEVLTLARVHGAAWHEGLCEDAAFYGNLELLQWLHKSGCPWDVLNVATNAVRTRRGQYRLILPWLLAL